MKDLWTRTLRMEVGESDGYPCVRLSGEGDSDGSRLLHGTLTRLVESGHTHLILDTRGVRFLDPHCLETITDGLRAVEEEGGRMVIVDQSRPVERTLKLLDIERIIPVFPSMSQAAAYLSWHE